MSLPDFSTQSELFSLAGLSSRLFESTDPYRLFAQKVFPVLAQARTRLQAAYCADNGRVAIEPVLLLGVSLLQYLDWRRCLTVKPSKCSVTMRAGTSL